MHAVERKLVTRFAVVFVIAGFASQVSGATVGYWRFEEASGNALDSSGNGYDLTLASDTSSGSGPSRVADVPISPVPQTGATNTQSMLFLTPSSVTGDTATSAAPGPEIGAGDFTMEGFFKLNDTFDPNYEHHMGKHVEGATGDRGWQLMLRRPGGGNIQLVSIVGAGAGNAFQFNGTDNIPFGQWQHVAMVRSGDTLTTYLNGSVYTSGSVGSGLDFSGLAAVPFRIGANFLNNGTVLRNTNVDEVRLSNVALSPSQFLNAIPEPSSTLLLAIAGIMIALERRRK